VSLQGSFSKRKAAVPGTAASQRALQPVLGPAGPAKDFRPSTTERSYLPNGRDNGFTVPSFLPFLTAFAFAMIVFLLFLFESFGRALRNE
jgi:hypothetical protein